MNNNEKIALLKEALSLLEDYANTATDLNLYGKDYREKLDNTYKEFALLMERQLHITELDWLDAYYEELRNDKYNK